MCTGLPALGRSPAQRRLAVPRTRRSGAHRRGPLLIISGEKDHTVPWAIANASYKREERNEGVTEIVMVPNRGHSLTIDSGWREVCEKAIEFVKRFV
jgi:non-heme chloroperoxidase